MRAVVTIASALYVLQAPLSSLMHRLFEAEVRAVGILQGITVVAGSEGTTK